MADTQITKFLSGVVGVVGANSFEVLSLWEDYHQRRKVPWVQHPFGCGEIVGYLDHMPVMLSLRTAEVDGHKILFIDPTSQVVDYRLIDAWLEKMLPGIKKTDAMNFHNAFPRKDVEHGHQNQVLDQARDRDRAAVR